jgi:hypothetical protein
MQTTIINVTCDGENCKHVRANDTNHWLVGICIMDQILLTISRDNLRPFDTNGHPIPIEQLSEVKDFCGEQCAIKWVSRMLTEIKK